MLALGPLAAALPRGQEAESAPLAGIVNQVVKPGFEPVEEVPHCVDRCVFIKRPSGRHQATINKFSGGYQNFIIEFEPEGPFSIVQAITFLL